MNHMSDSRELASTNLNFPEWRRNATPAGNFLSAKQFARRPRAAVRWKDHRFIPELRSEVRERSSWEHITGPTPGISLESLGTDLVSIFWLWTIEVCSLNDSDSEVVQWFLISTYVPKSTLLLICQTSPLLHAQVIPVLYYSIDLSTHDPPDGVTISFRHRRKTYERQFMFKQQISLNPEYAQHVRSLKWTVGLEYEQVWTVALGKFGFSAPISSQGERVVWRSEDVGKLFQSLTQVVKLDIQWLNSGIGLIASEGKDLFPFVQNVNFVSLFTFYLSSTLTLRNQRGSSHVASILSGTSKNTVSTLQLGPYPVERPDWSGLTARDASSSSSSSTPNKPPEYKKYHDIIEPSFMLRCRNLHTLSVIIQHVENREEIRDFCKSLSTFLLSIRPHSFIFDLVGMNGQSLPQRVSVLRHPGGTCRRCSEPVAPDVYGRLQPIDKYMLANIPENFRAILLPVLMKGWEGLQRVEIRGIMRTFLEDLRMELNARAVVLASDGWEEDLLLMSAKS